MYTTPSIILSRTFFLAVEELMKIIKLNCSIPFIFQESLRTYIDAEFYYVLQIYILMPLGLVLFNKIIKELFQPTNESFFVPMNDIICGMFSERGELAIYNRLHFFEFYSRLFCGSFFLLL